MNLPGYMTEKQAMRYGFTHNASYYGLPVYVSMDEKFMVAAKWAALDFLLPVISFIESSIAWMLPEREEGFMFKIKGELQ